MADELGEVMMERVFESVDAEGKTGKVTLRVGKPYFYPESKSSLKWRCPYQIVGIGLENVKEMVGTDAVDAMILALVVAEQRLKSCAKRITWMDSEILCLHYPFTAEITASEKSMDYDDDSPFKKAFEEFFRNFGKENPSPDDKKSPFHPKQ